MMNTVKNANKLNLEDLENVSGGLYYIRSDLNVEIIDDNNGEVLAVLGPDCRHDLDLIAACCAEKGVSFRETGWPEIDSLRSCPLNQR